MPRKKLLPDWKVWVFVTVAVVAAFEGVGTLLGFRELVRPVVAGLWLLVSLSMFNVAQDYYIEKLKEERDDLLKEHRASVMKSITCPECGSTTHHPEDVKQGYCSQCHWWTSDPQLAPYNPGRKTDG